MSKKLDPKELIQKILEFTDRGWDIATGTELGADGYTGKPFNPEELAERVDRILEVRYGARKDTAS